MNKSTNLKVAVSTDVCICDVNRNEIDDISVIEKCSQVDDFYDNYGECVNCPDSTKIDLHMLRNELEAELGATIDLDGEGLVPVTRGLELTSADKN